MRAHDSTALCGWEILTGGDMEGLGYTYEGTVTAAMLPDGLGYHLLVYKSGDEAAAPFLEQLRRLGTLMPYSR